MRSPVAVSNVAFPQEVTNFQKCKLDKISLQIQNLTAEPITVS